MDCSAPGFPVLHYIPVCSNSCPLRQWWRRQWQPTPVLLPGKSHGWRSLVGCSPWGLKESDATERLHFHFSFSCIGEGNGNPLQCSCLDNPRDGGASWAAVYGVAQSWTRLKWLSSSSSRPMIITWISIVTKSSFSLMTILFLATRCIRTQYTHNSIYNWSN